jgi:anti-sigma B factor antagonist
MKIKEKRYDDVLVLSFEGNLLGEPEITEARNHVYRVLEHGVRKIVLDLNKVDSINSSGLGTIIAILTSIQGKGGKLHLANVTEHVGSLLALTKLVKVLKTYETVNRAVQSF